MKTKTVTNYFYNVLSEFAQVVPPNHRNWSDVRYRAGRVNPSTRPNLYEYIVYGQPKMPSLREFSQILENDTDYQEFCAELASSNKANLTWIKSYSIAINLLEEYLDQVTQIKYDLNIAQTISENFVRFIKSRKSTLVTFSVVRGLNLDFDELALDKQTRLRKVNDDEASQLCKKIVHLHSNDNFPENNSILEYTNSYKLGIYDTHEPHKIMNVFDQIILALQLLKNGRVSREYMYHYYPVLGELGQDNDTRISHGKAIRRPPLHATYELHQNETSELMRIIKLLDNPLSERLATSIKRFNGAAIRIGYESEDMLLDLFIALEALYDSVQGSSSYSMRMRAAALLETSLDARRHIINLIIDGYNCRSKIVHGSKYKKNETKLKLEIDELVAEIYDLTRKSIVKVLEFGAASGKSMVAKDFDELLLSSK